MKRRCDAGVEGLASEANRKSFRRNCHLLTHEQKSKKLELVLIGGLLLNLLLSKSLKRLELKLKDGVSFICC